MVPHELMLGWSWIKETKEEAIEQGISQEVKITQAGILEVYVLVGS